MPDCGGSGLLKDGSGMPRSHSLRDVFSMRSAVATWAGPLALLTLGVAALLLQAAPGDYETAAVDAGPVIAAIVAGHPGSLFTMQPLMGSFSVVLRVPFALVATLAGGGEKAVYLAGVLPCLLAAGAFGVWLVARRPEPARYLLAVPLLAVLTPAALDAVQTGHPEEILGGVLCAAAVILAPRRAVCAGLALGLALATKQWAVIAIVPVLAGCRAGRRVTAAVVAGAVWLLFELPLAVGSSSAFSRVAQQATIASAHVSRANLWFLISHPVRLHLDVPSGFRSEATEYVIPSSISSHSHALIVALAAALALLGWWRRANPLAILALGLLLRCVLEPDNVEYYHAPFLLALLAYEVTARRDVRGLPAMTLFSVFGLWLTFNVLDAHHVDPHLVNGVYLAWTAIAAAYLILASGLVRIPAFRPRRLQTPRTSTAQTH